MEGDQSAESKKLKEPLKKVKKFLELVETIIPPEDKNVLEGDEDKKINKFYQLLKNSCIGANEKLSTLNKRLNRKKRLKLAGTLENNCLQELIIKKLSYENSIEKSEADVAKFKEIHQLLLNLLNKKITRNKDPNNKAIKLQQHMKYIEVFDCFMDYLEAKKNDFVSSKKEDESKRRLFNKMKEYFSNQKSQSNKEKEDCFSFVNDIEFMKAYVEANGNFEIFYQNVIKIMNQVDVYLLFIVLYNYSKNYQK